MTEAFGGPLYQMLNPGAQQIVDRFGLRGQGLSGTAAMVDHKKKLVAYPQDYKNYLKCSQN
jgi:hypothetical protein